MGENADKKEIEKTKEKKRGTERLPSKCPSICIHLLYVGQSIHILYAYLYSPMNS